MAKYKENLSFSDVFMPIRQLKNLVQMINMFNSTVEELLFIIRKPKLHVNYFKTSKAIFVLIE